MTPGNETIPAASRRMLRTAPAAAEPVPAASASRSEAAPAQRWTRRRGVLGVFAAFAALGLAGAYMGPAGMALAETEDVTSDSVYANAVDAAQSYVVAEEAADISGLSRDSYTVYVKPKPKPKPVVASPGSTWVPVFVTPNPGSAKAIAYDMVLARGWDDRQYSCLVALWARESGWRVNAHNSSSGAYGIPQALPGSKMASAGADWQTNPATQIKWGLGYIKGRYGTPCGAWQHSQTAGWY